MLILYHSQLVHGKGEELCTYFREVLQQRHLQEYSDSLSQSQAHVAPCPITCSFTMASTTFVPTVLSRTLKNPSSWACKQWRIIQMSASTWLQTFMMDKSMSFLHRTPVSFVIITVLDGITCCMIWSLRNMNNSVLLPSTRKKSCQFPGSVPFAWTRHLVPLPCLLLAVVLRLSERQ